MRLTLAALQSMWFLCAIPGYLAASKCLVVMVGLSRQYLVEVCSHFQCDSRLDLQPSCMVTVAF
jgi:hypothetical protein